MNIKEFNEKDRSSVLYPFTQLKDFATGKLGEPTIIETGKGIRIRDARGNELIDGFAGMYCVNIGYGPTEVAEAISRQAYRLAYHHCYAAHTTDELAILSDPLVKMALGKMSKVFYRMSGSDATRRRPSSSGTIITFAASQTKRRSFRANVAITAAASFLVR